MAKSRELRFSVCSGHSGQNGQRGRVGPPESVKSDGKAGKAGKAGKWLFRTVPRGTVEAGHIACPALPQATVRTLDT